MDSVQRSGNCTREEEIWKKEKANKFTTIEVCRDGAESLTLACHREQAHFVHSHIDLSRSPGHTHHPAGTRTIGWSDHLTLDCLTGPGTGA